jgi:hypothetical protein
VRYDFYVNRKLIQTQIRSKALPGPIGIDIGPDIAQLPFNYTVVATILVPNREFKTIIEGAVFASNLSGTFECTLTTEGSSETDDEIYTASNVQTVQSGNQSFALAFEAADSTGARTVKFSANVTVASGADNTLRTSGAMAINRSGVTQNVTGSGEGALTNDLLSEFDLVTEDGAVELSCSQ